MINKRMLKKYDNDTATIFFLDLTEKWITM